MHRSCPVDCIHPRNDEPQFAEIEQLFIDPVNCIDCGACIPVCPPNSIYAERTCRRKWLIYGKERAALSITARGPRLFDGRVSILQAQRCMIAFDYALLDASPFIVLFKINIF